jgi:hypothetical protein
MANRRMVTLGLTPADLGLFVAYVVMLCVFVPFHEPWVDEAQAWLMSRDLGFFTLVFHAIRHEGHPALWYVLLWVPTHLHASYSVFSWISAVIAAAGVWVLLRFAPFPFYLRALLPFTFFLGYQYSVVARSYVLFPLLGFLAAHLYRQRPPRPVGMAVVLGLLANVSVHGTIVAIAIWALYAGKIRKQRSEAGGEVASAREIWRGHAIFAGFILFVAICLWPTQGAFLSVGPTVTKMIDRLSIPVHTATPPQTPAPVAAEPTAPATAPPAALQPGAAVPAAGKSIPGMERLVNVRNVLTYAFAKSWLVAALFEVLVLVYLFRRSEIKLVLPLVLLAIFMTFVYGSLWHFGLQWIAVLMVLWMAWDESVPINAPDLQNAVAVFLGLLCVLQLPWTYGAFAYDARNPVSPDKAAAAYLHTLPPGSQIAGLGLSAGVQPYFEHNVFFNQPQTYGYLGRDRPQPTVEQAIADRPTYIVADPFLKPRIERTGYREISQFCGTLYFPNRTIDPGCLTVLERVGE